MTELERAVVDQAWTALTAGDVGASPTPPPLVVSGDPGALPSRFAVQDVAVASVAVALLAAVALSPPLRAVAPTAMLDRDHVAAAVRSERYFTVAGRRSGAGFAPLSRFWRTADGWVRTHANYPWHHAALLDALGTSPDEAEVGAAVADMAAHQVEERVVAAGGIAAAVRTVEQWRRHPQGRAVSREPLIGHEWLGTAPPRSTPAGTGLAAGLRVLDLTRVIAGPVCTRYLAALGASVLRVDPPTRPDVEPGSYADTLLGKRSAFLDLGRDGGRTALHGLLADADVVVTGYRPGALDRFGLAPAAVAERYPGLVLVVLDAWGHQGPWAGRRGFDSVVQAPTGIAHGESPDGAAPGALPCQLLDHATGYLAAAAALDGVRRQRQAGGTHVRRVSLARTAHWLTSAPAPGHVAGEAPGVPADPRRFAAGMAADGVGGLSAITPPGALDGTSLRWPSVSRGYGVDSPSWAGEGGDAPG